jgi:hypothetical protein
MSVREIFTGDRWPAYIRLAWELDDSFMQHGNCRPSRRGPVAQRAWIMEKGDADYSYAAQKNALAQCHLCPVQWECATWAIKAEQKFHIWADTPANRKALAGRPDWEMLIAAAAVKALPVQIVARRIKAGSPDPTYTSPPSG